ncbi:MAG: hypothetical protein R3208_01160 [Ketobacteraceae bacterium]|nr:hypothetical protein [Ketobacteraceae bacterium]
MRFQLFEFMDLPRTPRVLRDSVVESLGNAMRWSGVCKTAAPVFKEFCERLESRKLLDMCSGSGEPAAVLLDALKERGDPLPQFYISDLFPVSHQMAEVADKYPGNIEVIDTPLDASDVPDSHPHSGRMVISAFHHFPPELASKILKDSAEKGKAIFILEPMTRSGKGAFRMGFYFILANAANPFLSKQDRLAKGVFTYMIPLIPAMAAWDGLASILRMYTRKDFERLTADIDVPFEWEFRQVSGGLDNTVSIFMGRPVSGSAA